MNIFYIDLRPRKRYKRFPHTYRPLNWRKTHRNAKKERCHKPKTYDPERKNETY